MNKIFFFIIIIFQHLASPKHLNIIAGFKCEKTKKYSPYYNKKRLGDVVQQPLTNNFVTGGYR